MKTIQVVLILKGLDTLMVAQTLNQELIITDTLQMQRFLVDFPSQHGAVEVNQQKQFI